MTRAVLSLALALLVGVPVEARIVEEQFDLPVRVSDAYGKAIEQPIKVTVFRDDAVSAPQPLLVINHGRAVDAQERAAFGRARFADNARWFVQQGFVVALPTRIGYGVSGGEDVEETGPCNDKRYPPGFAVAAQQTVQVIAAVRARGQARADRGVIVGQSFGGATTVALAALNPPGVVAAINFAGGGGGNPKTQPGRPCSPHRLEAMFRDQGAAAKMPVLWVYTENDKYFGSTYPKEWFDAFRKAGGQGEFVVYPPAGEDGHGLFTAFPATWRPAVVTFLRAQGFEMKEETAK